MPVLPRFPNCTRTPFFSVNMRPPYLEAHSLPMRALVSGSLSKILRLILGRLPLAFDHPGEAAVIDTRFDQLVESELAIFSPSLYQWTARLSHERLHVVELCVWIILPVGRDMIPERQR